MSTEDDGIVDLGYPEQLRHYARKLDEPRLAILADKFADMERENIRLHAGIGRLKKRLIELGEILGSE